VNSEAAQVTASGDIGVAAGRDVNLTTATESDYHYKEETKTKKGFLSKKTTHTIEEDSATREAGTLLSGDNVTVQAGNNLLVKGSAVVGDNTWRSARATTSISWRLPTPTPPGALRKRKERPDGRRHRLHHRQQQKHARPVRKRAPPRARASVRWARRAVTSRFLPETRPTSAARI
jgi:hypothetical protein